MHQYSQNLRVLAPPVRPEEAELVSGAHIKQLIESLRPLADFIIIDTAQNFQEPVLAALDESDEIAIISTLDIPTVKNVRLCLDVMQGVLEYPVDKTKLVVNRDAEDIGIKASLLEDKLGISTCARIPSDGRLAIQAANTGATVLSSPKAPISQGIRELAQTIAGGEDLAAAAGMGGANPGFFGKILHRLRA